MAGGRPGRAHMMFFSSPRIPGGREPAAPAQSPACWILSCLALARAGDGDRVRAELVALTRRGSGISHWQGRDSRCHCAGTPASAPHGHQAGPGCRDALHRAPKTPAGPHLPLLPVPTMLAEPPQDPWHRHRSGDTTFASGPEQPPKGEKPKQEPLRRGRAEGTRGGNGA